MFVCLNDLVDTLKIQFYPTDKEKQKIKFNMWIDYLSKCKLEAMDIKSNDSQERYKLINIDGIKLRVMATSQTGFSVVCQNADFTLSLRTINEHSNPVIKAEFRAEFLLRNGYKRALKTVIDFVKNFLPSFEIKVSEIHLAKDIQGYNFSILDFYRLKTLKRNKQIFEQDTNLFYSGLKFTGFSIGKGAEMLRIYNKTHEIDKNKNKAFVQYLSWQNNPEYDEKKTVWRIEFQLRREKLKELYKMNDIPEKMENLESLLSSISSVWHYLINRFVLKNFSIKECQEIQSGFKIQGEEITILNQEAIKKRFQRADISPLWEFIKSFKGNVVEKLQTIKDISKPSVQYVKNAFKSVLSTFVKLKRGDFNKTELTEILLSAEKELQETKKISLLDNARLKCIEYVSRANDFLNHTGIDKIAIEDFEHSLKDNLLNLINKINENVTRESFNQFKERIA